MSEAKENVGCPVEDSLYNPIDYERMYKNYLDNCESLGLVNTGWKNVEEFKECYDSVQKIVNQSGTIPNVSTLLKQLEKSS